MAFINTEGLNETQKTYIVNRVRFTASLTIGVNPEIDDYWEDEDETRLHITDRLAEALGDGEIGYGRKIEK